MGYALVQSKRQLSRYCLFDPFSLNEFSFEIYYNGTATSAMGGLMESLFDFLLVPVIIIEIEVSK